MTRSPFSQGKLRAHSGRWRAGLLGLGLLVGLGAQSFAAEPEGLQGRWVMATKGSSFREAVTGPAPDAAQMVVTRDDPQRFAYQLIESRRGVEVARATYDVSFAGQRSVSRVDGQELPIAASRGGPGDVVLRAPPVAGSQASIHVRLTGPDTAVVEHEVSTDDGVIRLETIALTRTNDAGQDQ
jgi:hypothetical protein